MDGSPGDAGVEGLVSIKVTPATATLTITEGTPVTQAFTAEGTFEKGPKRDVTDLVAWTLDADASNLGQFSENVFSSLVDHGGAGKVLANIGDSQGTAALTVVMARTINVDPSAGDPIPSNPGELFAGANDDARAPSVVYPNDNVVLPPNLGRVEIHWLKGSAENTLFEVSFTNTVTAVKAYVRCERPAGVQADGCIWEPSGDIWLWLAETNRGGEAFEVKVRGAADTASTVGTSGTISIQISKDDIDGTLYYWTTSGGTRIVRYDFGAAAQTPETVLGPSNVSANKCVGCHAISHDGRKIMASAGGIGNGGFVLVDLEGPTVVKDQSASNVIQWGSFSPDGNELVGVYGDDPGHVTYDLLLFDTRCDAANMATCGNQTGTIPLNGGEASHPVWSPDDDLIAYTAVGVHSSSQRPIASGISFVTRTGGTWGAPQVLVPTADGLNRYSPSFSPEGDFIVYNESTCPGGDEGSLACNADSDPSSKIWAVPTGGGTPVQLAKAVTRGALDGSDDLQASFPRFAPFTFVLSKAKATRVTWMTFASQRAYGLRVPPNSDNPSEAAKIAWLWMTAIDPDAVTDGEDGSYPAFALPFQELTTSNHIGVWTTQAVGVPDLL